MSRTRVFSIFSRGTTRSCASTLTIYYPHCRYTVIKLRRHLMGQSFSPADESDFLLGAKLRAQLPSPDIVGHIVDMCRFALVLCICAHTFHKEFLLVSSK